MSDKLRVRVELDLFFERLRELEEGAQGLGGGRGWYISSAFRTRVRYSWYQAAVAGRPAICLANQYFFDPAIGARVVQAMARFFTHGPHRLEAQTLVFEHPRDPALCLWLAESSFTAIRAPGESELSWYLNRPPAARPSEDHLALEAVSLPVSYADLMEPGAVPLLPTAPAQLPS